MKTLFMILVMLALVVAPASAQFFGGKSVDRWETVSKQTAWWGDTLICSNSADSTGSTTFVVEDFPWNGMYVLTKYDTAIAGNVVCDRVIVQVRYNWESGGTYDSWINVDTLTAAGETWTGATPQAITLPAQKPYSMQVRHWGEDASTCKAFAESRLKFY